MARGQQLAETGMGALVLVVAGVFFAYALSAGGRGGPGGYDVTAKFGNVGSLAPGADVKVAGVKVGTVTSLALDPKTFLAVAHLRLNDDVKLPSDSTAKITSDGLLGGALVAFEPGGAPDNLKAGGEIENTQGAVDIFGLIGQFLRPPAPGAAAGASAAGAAPAAATSAQGTYPAPAGQ